MLIEYIDAAMHKSKYEYLADDKKYYGEIEATKGVWATGETLEACRDELKSVLEGWLLLKIHDHDHDPVFDGINLEINEDA